MTARSKKQKKFDPLDPFPPYPPPEKETGVLVERDPDDFYPYSMGRAAAAEAHGLYPAERDQQDAFENGYIQGVEDVQAFVRGD